MNNNDYLTRELSLAVYLKGMGMTYRGIEKITQGSYFFVFKERDKCVELEKKFLTSKSDMLKDIEMAERNV
jgi:hypothetical protein